ncbi:unnamed protein product [Dracunculus medinensis]|uniref:LITAF domain-containing protein n=1 Tax=Dracunculus medinensis TaxID=318479 RepID=A0A0N4U6I9_DRAME|nr:unnamed protein product [Dracunculus medinensis]
MASRIEPSNVAPPPYESAIADDFQKTPTAPVAIIPQTQGPYTTILLEPNQLQTSTNLIVQSPTKLVIVDNAAARIFCPKCHVRCYTFNLLFYLFLGGNFSLSYISLSVLYSLLP